MDQQNLLRLLRDLQTPDTGKVKTATAELKKTYYTQPQTLLLLLQISTSHDDIPIRQHAAVEALRLVPKHWEALPKDQKPQIREHILKAAMAESDDLVRHSDARVISAIAKIDLDDGEWTDLPNLLLQACTSKEVRHREIGVYILFTLLETLGDEFSGQFPALFNLFGTTIKDPESQEVRINTMLALSRMAMLIEPDEDAKSVQAFQKVFPGMVSILKTAIEEKNDTRTEQAFEVFQTLLGCESALMANHFRELVQFMIDIATEASIDDEARSQALSFLMQCVKFRRMKIQGMQGMGEQLTLKSMQIAAEMAEDDEDEDEVTPSRSALGLLDLLAEGLPPRQVVVPLMKALPQFVDNPNPAFRQAGVISLGMCAEGAPDFVATQITEILPIVLKLLNDPDIKVRQAALHGASRLADELYDDWSKHADSLIPALLKNLDAASIEASDETTQKRNLKVMVAACTAIDSLVDGMVDDKEKALKYAPDLVPRLGRLFSHPDLKVKASAAGAMGSIAGATEEGFMPYFEPTMKALSEYVNLKDSNDELDLRGTVCDALGTIAQAVGKVAFEPYVQPLMRASEEGLNLGHPRLRETSYILWSTLAKVYGESFLPFLDGVVKGLFQSLEQEESDFEVELGEAAADLVGQEVTIAGRKIKVAAAGAGDNDEVDEDDMDDDDDDDDEDDDDDWENMLNGVTQVGLEKEIAVEVLGDVLTHTRENFLPYLEKSVEIVMGLVEHSYEGVRKCAIATLWRAYACLWGMMEDRTGEKWQAGFPLKTQPTPEINKLGEIAAVATVGVWGDELDRAVVTDINRNIGATLKVCGPAVLAHGNLVEQMTTILAAIITRSHPCQQDLGDEEDLGEIDESSEYDWLVVDTALDALVGLALALGPQFGEIWKVFEKPVMKLASSQVSLERSTAVGVIAECTASMGDAVSPYTSQVLKLLLHRMSDEDDETKSNAAYAIGLLITHSSNTEAYLSSYNQILSKLEPLLHTEQARTQDNAAGCVTRMIMAHPDKVPIDEVLPVLVDFLPLKEDFEENKPIFECIVGLYQHGDETVRKLTPKLIPVFAEVLSDDKQLEDDTKAKVVETVKYLAKQNPALIQGHEILAKAAAS